MTVIIFWSIKFLTCCIPGLYRRLKISIMLTQKDMVLLLILGLHGGWLLRLILFISCYNTWLWVKLLTFWRYTQPPIHQQHCPQPHSVNNPRTELTSDFVVLHLNQLLPIWFSEENVLCYLHFHKDKAANASYTGWKGKGSSPVSPQAPWCLKNF
jgi:hypothetical protein